jgi:hypothetical protein
MRDPLPLFRISRWLPALRFHLELIIALEKDFADASKEALVLVGTHALAAINSDYVIDRPEEEDGRQGTAPWASPRCASLP